MCSQSNLSNPALQPLGSQALRILLLVSVLALSACGGTVSDSATLSEAMSEAAQLGEKIFKDVSLSASGQMSCETCHVPANGHASPFANAVALGGKALDQPGTRTPPSIRYLRYNQAFRFEADGTPTGGFNWDGRTNSLAEQAHRPFFSANEMANLDAAEVIAKLATAPYAKQFKVVFGESILDDPDTAFERITFALERYQKEDPDFAPFSSKFDAFIAGKVSLSAQELNGLSRFNRSDKGNCAACHPSSKPSNAPAALFTDFSFDNLGVPRNRNIAANLDPNYFDLGLCGPARTTLTDRGDLCGAFKVPSLRNVALRQRFFHNGRFGSLEEVVSFYVKRDTEPERWYPLDASAEPVSYNDLPIAARANVNVTEGPYNRSRGLPAALSESEIQDLVAFLKTLSDGYVLPR